jgi:hypothetical protein
MVGVCVLVDVAVTVNVGATVTVDVNVGVDVGSGVGVANPARLGIWQASRRNSERAMMSFLFCMDELYLLKNLKRPDDALKNLLSSEENLQAVPLST